MDSGAVAAIRILIGVLMIVFGIVLAFWGVKLVRAAAKFIGAIVGALIGSQIFLNLVLPYNNYDNWFADGYPDEPLKYYIGLMIFVLIFSLIFAFLAYALLKGFVAFSIAAASFYMCYFAAGEPPSPFTGGGLNGWWIMCLVVGIIVYVFVHIYFDQLLAYLTAAGGGFIVGSGIGRCLGAAGVTANLALVLVMTVGLVIALFGAKYQLTGRFTDEPDRGE